MATLAVEKGRLFAASVEPVLAKRAVIAADILYRGSALGFSSGNLRPLVAGDSFAGFAEETVDNSSGAAGDKSCTYRQKGVVEAGVTGVSASTAPGTAIYMSDDDVFTTASTSNSQIGKLHQHVSGTTCQVYFEGAAVRSI